MIQRKYLSSILSKCRLRPGFWALIPACLLNVLLLGCSVKPPASSTQPGRVTNYTVCALPQDQGSGSYQGRWQTLPIPVAIDQDFYLADQGGQAAQIRLAIQTWNEWARLRGKVAFTIVNDGTGLGAGAPIPVTTDCSRKTITDARPDVMGIWKIQAGGDGRNERTENNTPCKLLDTGIQGFTDWTVNATTGIISGASILLNFDEFNTSSGNTVDVQSLVLHELGHVLGLLHSCNPGNGDTTTAVACGQAPFRYLEAVMYFQLGLNEIRRQLRQNDYSRINCIY